MFFAESTGARAQFTKTEREKAKNRAVFRVECPFVAQLQHYDRNEITNRRGPHRRVI
jgi:hypothetical protein